MSSRFSGSSYDAILLVSFGGPEAMSDVMPFLENVLKGRNVPRERMLEVAKHYELFGGVSPINEQNRKLIAALERDLQTNGPNLPVYFGNRNWHPLLVETLTRMRDDGVKRALAFVTSAYSCYSSCRQYLEDIEHARASVGPEAPTIDKIRAFYNHPLFIQVNVEHARDALERIPEERRSQTPIVFTAHSIPLSMAQGCEYETQLHETARLVAEGLATRTGEAHPYRLVFQSRSGSPAQPWLEPDLSDHFRQLKAVAVKNVVVAPIGFISDHMEIIYDLDFQAQNLCDQIGLNMQRAATAGTHPVFIEMIRELILERLEPARERRFLGALGPANDACSPNCCMVG